MRIRNRPTSFPSSFPPSTSLPLTPCTNPPKLAPLQPPAAAPAPGRVIPGKEEAKSVGEGPGEKRESGKGGHFPQIDCCFAGALSTDDGGKTMALGHVGMETWKVRGKKLWTAPAGSGKRSVEEVDGSNGTLKELMELASYQAASKGCNKRREREAKKRSRDNGAQEWSDDEELILPMKKKRKIKFQRRADNVGSGSKEQMRRKLELEESEEEDAFGANKSMNGKTSCSKKTKAGADGGGVLMEGSRCSRINGRGWRCSQLTLVGYSLCEHHLGKARLKSMSSIRGRQSTASRLPQTGTKANHLAPISNSNGTDDQMPLIEAMKGHAKKNVGSVKARSMSSLLGVNTDAHLAP